MMTARTRHLYHKSKQQAYPQEEHRGTKTQSSLSPFYKFSASLCLCVEKMSYLCTKDKQHTLII